MSVDRVMPIAAPSSPPLAEPAPRILVLAFARLEEMLAKGNVWYVRHFEQYFHRVFLLYEFGRLPRARVRGRTTLISIGSRYGGFFDLLISPVTLYRLTRQLKPSVILSSDQVFLFWTGFLVRLLLRRKIALLPVCIPEEIHRATGHAVTIGPVWVERLLILLTRRSVDVVISPRSFNNYAWMTSKPGFRHKIVEVDTWPDALPSPEFLDAVAGAGPAAPDARGEFVLIYVGRLHREKQVADLLRMLAELRRIAPQRRARLLLVGDGPESDALKALAAELGIADRVDFVAFVPNGSLPALYARASAFVSTVTGTSLREAALCGLPIISYAIPWVSRTFSDGENATLTPFGDYAALAQRVRELMEDDALRRRLGQGAKTLACTLWSTNGLGTSLALVEEAVS